MPGGRVLLTVGVKARSARRPLTAAAHAAAGIAEVVGACGAERLGHRVGTQDGDGRIGGARQAAAGSGGLR
ncbi:hypothetical protein GCM10009660_05980 [Catellatospora bangladeshensis]